MKPEDDFAEVYEMLEHAIDLAFSKGSLQLKFYDYLKYRKTKKYEVDEFINDGMVHFPHWLGKEEFHSSHRANLLRKDYEYYSKFGWKEDLGNPYVWHDKEGLWYEQIVGTKERIYL